VVLGVPMALVLARTRFPGQGLLRSLVLLPLVLPPVVGGIALLYTFGRRGLLGGGLDLLGWQVAFSTTAVVLAQTFVALPFLVLSVEGALRGVDPRYADAAATLGASPLVTFVRVVLPLAAPGLAAGAVLAFARALGEFGSVVLISGNLPYKTEVASVFVFGRIETGDLTAAAAVSVVLLATALLILVALGRVVRPRWSRGV
jgi:molybdate transport system permease protein